VLQNPIFPALFYVLCNTEYAIRTTHHAPRTTRPHLFGQFPHSAYNLQVAYPQLIF
jgi:hypothetical protein